MADEKDNKDEGTAESEFIPEMEVSEPETEEEKGMMAAVDKQLEVLGVKPDEDAKTDDEKAAEAKAAEDAKAVEDAKTDDEKAAEAKAAEDAKAVEDAKTDDEKAAEAKAAEDAKTDEEKAAEAKAAEDAKAVEDAKSKRPSDQFGELPEGSKVETKERFEKMRQGFDDVHGELETVKADLQGQIDRNQAWADTIRSTGTNPEQYGLLMQYVTDVNEGTTESYQRAYDTMSKEMQWLSEKLGKEAPGFDPLGKHPDLKSDFDEGKISHEHALELAAGRSASKINKDAATIAETNKNVADANTEALTQARQDLVDVGNRIRGTDPHYEAKKEQLVRITKLVTVTESDPSKWAALIEREYKKIPVPVSAIRPAKKKVTDAIRPGTLGTGAGVIAKKAGSIHEAVDMALDAMP